MKPTLEKVAKLQLCCPLKNGKEPCYLIFKALKQQNRVENICTDLMLQVAHCGLNIQKCGGMFPPDWKL